MKIKNIIFISVSIIIFMILNYFFVNKYFNSWEVRGQFGDSFGVITALFSGLAFAGLIYAIFLQRKELSLQRQELKLQREEMAKSREQLAAQVDIFKAQFKVDIAKIRVSAYEAEIEAIKMDSGSRVSDARGSFIKDIIDKRTKLLILADDLEELLK